MSKLYPKLQTGGIVPNKSQKTTLTQGQQLAYEKWKSENKYNESDDYDLAGYWKEEGMKGLSFPNLSPIEKIKEVESSKYPTLDTFYKKYPHVAGMNHSPGEVSRNPYSKLPIKNLNQVIELEKSRDIISNDKHSPQPKFKITKEQTQFFKDIQDNSDETVEYYNSPKKIQRQTLASRELVEDPKYYTKEQHEFGDKLRSYMYTKPNHLPDKFKRLAPFSNGDGYMLMSEESKYSGNPSYNLSDKNGNPINTSFDKRGQGFWQGNQFIAYQQGGTLSQLGYKRHSPYNKASSLLIHTPTGSITMKEVDHPILGISKGEIKFMLPNKEYQFKSNQVLEIPMKSLYPKGQNGMKIPKLNSLQKDSLDLYNFSQLQKKLQGSKTLKEDDSWFKNPIDYLINELDSFRGYKENTKQFFQNSKYNEIREKDLHRISKGRNIEQLTSSNKKLWEVGDNLVKNNPNITYMNPLNSPDLFHKTILKTGNHGDTSNAVSFDYKKPSFYDSYYQEKNKKPVGENNAVITSRLSSIKPATPQKTTKNSTIQEKEKPIVERMSEMTPIQTIQPQVQDTLVQRPITMKTIYPSKPHVWNTSTPPTKKVERAQGLGGYNKPMMSFQQGGQAPEMSQEQQQEIVRRVRNLRKTIGYNKVGSVPLDGIQFRHYMYVNKKKLQKEDEELLGAFDEEQMVKLMNEVPDENEIPMGQTGMQMPTSPHNRIIKDADKQIMLNVIKSAHKNRVDPYTAVSIGLQETGLLKSDKWSRDGLNPLHDNSTISDEGSLDRSMLFLKKKFDYAKQLGKTDEASQIQAWNGYGKMRPSVNQKSLATWALNNEDAFDKAMSSNKLDSLENAYRKPRDKMYGISFTKDNPLDFNKNPVYGKRILDIRENFVKKDIPTVNMINSIIGLGNSPGQYVLTKPNQTSVKLFKLGGKIGSKSKMYPKCKCGCGGVSVGKNKMFQQGGTMDVLDGDGNSQMTITGGERIFSRIATKRMRQLNEEGNYKELGKFVCDELYAQDKRDPQYVKE